jgi:cell division initiation protein
VSERLTPVDILNMRFRRRLRGYAFGDVDEFVRQAATELERALADNAALKEKLASAEREVAQYRALESTMKDALILAQKAADETRAAAHAQAEAKHRETEAQIQQAASQILRLQEERRRFAREMHARLTAQMQWLAEELETPEAPTSPSVPATTTTFSAVIATKTNSETPALLSAVQEESLSP